MRSACAKGALASFVVLLVTQQWVAAFLSMLVFLVCLFGQREHLRLSKDRLIVRETEAIAPWAAILEVNSVQSTQELELVINMQDPAGGTVAQTFTFPRLDRPVQEIVALIETLSPNLFTRFNGKTRFYSQFQRRRLPAGVPALKADAGLRDASESTAVVLPVTRTSANSP